VFKANRCAWGICQQATVANIAISDQVRYWSKVESWPSGALPVEGDEVHIEAGWNMIFDLQESPIVKMLIINGRLTFQNDSSTDLHLRAKHIYVRAGELRIGTKEYPFQNKAKITLYGEKNFEHMVYDNAIEAGNKLIANVGLVQMWGKSRTS
jgi:cell migration-inducing and hyaluronan-binding protein